MKMRFLSLLLPALLLGLPLYGQLQPKTMFAGGEYQFFSDFDNLTGFSSSTEAGIVTDGAFALGGRLVQSLTNFHSDVIPEQSVFGGALFARYYLPSESGSVFFMSLEAGVDALAFYLEDEDGNETIDETFTTFRTRLGVGLDQFIAPTAAVETVAGFFYSKTEEEDALWGVSADLGLRLFLPAARERMSESGPALAAGMSMVGGTGAFTGHLSGNNFLSLSLNPEYGYLLTPFFMVGAEAQYFTATDAGNTLALRPLLRFYLNPQSRFKVFLTGVGGIQYQSNDSASETLWQLRAGPGINHFLTSDLALEAFLGYRSLDLGNEFNDELIATLGIRAFLGGEAVTGED